ncbi:transmembrane alpha-helix domain-containing protein [Colletotrichum plurivorum]|uniref:Transmembrane alpha-helix domain-containing protein n=1 Tax=Colletotrichum plurivorum TaxID=2175906 RepID=A0A8H6K7Z1_9PEZI|nr:transmembrane alpha-helix domain-containing protein [Colletotrichum plurivorum]
MAATATTTSSSSTSTNTYSSVVVTSFPFNPLTTQFAAPTYCDAVYDGNIFMVDPQEDCLPPSHPKQETAYYSPGFVCPKGYMTAKVDNKGVRSITTVTCCPYRSDIILSAVDPATLSGQWVGLFCTWIAPEGTRIDVVHTADTRTWTQLEYVTSPGGVNAYGVRMVYQSTDVEYATESSFTPICTGNSTESTFDAICTGNSTFNETTFNETQNGFPGLSKGESIAVAAVVPVVVFALVAGALFWWWRKRQASKYSRVNDNSVSSNQTPNQAPTVPPATYQPGHVHEAPAMQQQQLPPVQTTQSMHSFPTTYQPSTASPSVQQSPSVAYSQQYDHNGAYASYAGYKSPGTDHSPSVLTGQPMMPTSELPAPVPRELPENRPSHTPSGMHIDDQKMMGVDHLK